MDRDNLTITFKNAQVVAARYHRRCWWTDEEDLRQQAILEQLKSAETFDPERGIWQQYSWRVAVNGLRRYVLKQSAPVSAEHDLNVLKGLQRTDLASLADMVHSAGDAEHDRMLVQIRERVEFLVGKDGADFALGMLSEGWTAAEVAKQNGIRVRRVYATIAKVRKALEEDRVLYDMWRVL